MNYTDFFAFLPLIAGLQIQIPPQAAAQITSARKWLIKAENLYGAENPMTVPFLYELAARTVRYGSNGFRTALPLLQRAYDIQLRQGFADGPDMATAMAKLGECLIFTGDHEKAEELLKKALVIREKLFGEDDPLAGQVYASLTMLYIAGSNPSADIFMLMMQLSLNPLPTLSMQGDVKIYAEKALNSYNKLQAKKYDTTGFQPKNEFNYNAMSTAFSLEEQMTGDFDQRLKDMNSSSGGTGGQTHGCFIATAVYGSYDSPEVLVLRKFRDEVLEKNILGRAFIRIYYKFGPLAAGLIKNKPLISGSVRNVLDALVTWKSR
ncbi:MAG TPA: tetratricopeptide repeat protein [Clostridiales bacterium]|nr:tetratricopeptide repeat protein [Clostridiales bacterium]